MTGGGRLAEPDDELTKRFVRVVADNARLEVVSATVYDCGSHGDDLYLVMQLINGLGRLLACYSTTVRRGTWPGPWRSPPSPCSVLGRGSAGSLLCTATSAGN
ncbi:hypothetical protein [Streptosporangium vulgare]|uniref:hypothetical protein n=1 Tax=Streptosporangium vulgare TaxID=46190 RepID=UPI0031D8B391